MTHEEAQGWSAAVKTVFEIAKEAIAAWPSDEKKAKAEAALKEAELSMAVKFEYQLCQRHMPPGPMIQHDSGWKCMVCGFDTAHTTPTKIRTHLSEQKR